MKIKKTVKEAMELLQIKKLRRNQIKPINSILDKHDTMVIAPTSYGKSLIYQIPAIIQKKKLTVVIEPLLALIHDQVEKLQRLGIWILHRRTRNRTRSWRTCARVTYKFSIWLRNDWRRISSRRLRRKIKSAWLLWMNATV